MTILDTARRVARPAFAGPGAWLLASAAAVAIAISGAAAASRGNRMGLLLLFALTLLAASHALLTLVLMALPPLAAPPASPAPPARWPLSQAGLAQMLLAVAGAVGIGLEGPRALEWAAAAAVGWMGVLVTARRAAAALPRPVRASQTWALLAYLSGVMIVAADFGLAIRALLRGHWAPPAFFAIFGASQLPLGASEILSGHGQPDGHVRRVRALVTFGLAGLYLFFFLLLRSPAR